MRSKLNVKRFYLLNTSIFSNAEYVAIHFLRNIFKILKDICVYVYTFSLLNVALLVNPRTAHKCDIRSLLEEAMG